jgi:hypothetical protein
MCNDSHDGSLFDYELLTFTERQKLLKTDTPDGLQFSLRLKSVIHRQTSQWRFVLTASQFGNKDFLNRISVEVTLDGPDFREHPLLKPFEFSIAGKSLASLFSGLVIRGRFLESGSRHSSSPYALEVSCAGDIAGTPVEAQHLIPAFHNPAAFATDFDEAVGAAATPGCKAQRACRPREIDPNTYSCQERTCTVRLDGTKEWGPWREISTNCSDC